VRIQSQIAALAMGVVGFVVECLVLTTALAWPGRHLEFGPIAPGTYYDPDSKMVLPTKETVAKVTSAFQMLGVQGGLRLKPENAPILGDVLFPAMLSFASQTAEEQQMVIGMIEDKEVAEWFSQFSRRLSEGGGEVVVSTHYVETSAADDSCTVTIYQDAGCTARELTKSVSADDETYEISNLKSIELADDRRRRGDRSRRRSWNDAATSFTMTSNCARFETYSDNDFRGEIETWDDGHGSCQHLTRNDDASSIRIVSKAYAPPPPPREKLEGENGYYRRGEWQWYYRRKLKMDARSALWEPDEQLEILSKGELQHEKLLDEIIVVATPGEAGRARAKMWQAHPLLSRLSPTRFNGIDGTTLNATATRGIVSTTYTDPDDNTAQLSPGERAIDYNWARLAQRVVDKGQKRVLVLEDDALILDPEFAYQVRDFIEDVPTDADLLLVGFAIHSNPSVRNKPAPGSRSAFRVHDYHLHHAVILTNSGARKILANLPMNLPIEPWLCTRPGFNIYRHGLTMPVNHPLANPTLEDMGGYSADLRISTVINQAFTTKYESAQESAAATMHDAPWSDGHGHTLVEIRNGLAYLTTMKEKNARGLEMKRKLTVH